MPIWRNVSPLAHHKARTCPLSGVCDSAYPSWNDRLQDRVLPFPLPFDGSILQIFSICSITIDGMLVNFPSSQSTICPPHVSCRNLRDSYVQRGLYFWRYLATLAFALWASMHVLIIRVLLPRPLLPCGNARLKTSMNAGASVVECTMIPVHLARILKSAGSWILVRHCRLIFLQTA